MTRLVRAEVRKLCTTIWFPVTLLVSVVVVGISTASSVFTAGTRGAAPLGTSAATHHILNSSALTSMVMLGVGIAVMAGEYRHGTSIPTFLIAPRRPEVVLAKVVTVAMVGGALGLVAFGVSVGLAVPLLASKDVHHLAGDTAWMALGAVVGSALFGIIGVALGAITRNTTAAIVGAVVWVNFVEAGLLSDSVPSVGKWTPTGADSAVGYTGTHLGSLLPPWAGGLVLLAWGGFFTAVALRFVVRRDV